MKELITKLLNIVIFVFIFSGSYSQQELSGIKAIRLSDLESYVSFLASPLLKGRMNGGEGLELATNFIATEAKLIGLKPANNGSYFQQFTVLQKSYDSLKTIIQISDQGKSPVNLKKPFYQLIPTGVFEMELEGEVVFAGYGINSDKYNYYDLDSISIRDKIIMIMNGAPIPDNLDNSAFAEPMWKTVNGLYSKLSTLLNLQAKAILVVMDPKSGTESIAEFDSGLSEYLKTSIYLKGNAQQVLLFPGNTRVIYIHREVADALLSGSGHSLEELQRSIDSSLKPQSFLIENKQLKITSVVKTEEKVLKNVAGIIEGSDPVLKKEILVFSAHADHMGISEDGRIFAGADDNATGCSALLELAHAFSDLKKKPLRSILFLWVSGEEIGLFGSESYVNNPLFPLANTVADINLDMIGRTKSRADTSDANPMTGPETVFVISDDQSSELNKIAAEVDKKSILIYDYSLSDKNNPLNIFERSDQYIFVQKNIPILLFTTGLHTTYHTPDDTVEKIDFKKLELITKDVFKIGFIIANNRKRIVVDNPFSSW